MNLEERENYNLEDRNFQNNERYEDPDIDAPPANHSISNNAEPDYGNDLENQEIGSEKFDNESLGTQERETDEFNTNELDDGELDDEFDNEDLDNDDLDNEDLGNLDDEDDTKSDRNL